MRLLEHIKLAVFVGLATGILHGTIDIIARVFSGNFEWFEAYQALFFSIVVFMLGFLFLGFVIGLLAKIISLKIAKKYYAVFYFLTALFSLLFFYLGAYANLVLLSGIPLRSPVRIAANLILIVSLGAAYLTLLTKGKSAVLRIISNFKTKRLEKTIRAAFAAIIVFISISFFIDIYLINAVPNFPAKGNFDVPNIIIMSLITMRADHLSSYGYHLETSPNIDKLARDAVLFENAISPSPLAQPSHAGILTGKYITGNGVIYEGDKLADSETTLAEMLRAKGYNTAAFIGRSQLKAEFGFDQGFMTYNDRTAFFAPTHNSVSMAKAIRIIAPKLKKLLNQDEISKAEEVNDDIFKWLDKNYDNPFFIYAYYSDMHGPYSVKGEFTNINGSNEFENYTDEEFYALERDYLRKGNITPNIRDSMVKFYDNDIRQLDKNMGKLFDKIDELGLKDNTIIIITGVHGQEFFDHGNFGHQDTLYQEVIHVPLIVYYPNKINASRVEETVSTIDIFPTLLDILDIEIPDNIDGVSLLPLATNEGDYGRDYVKSELFGLP
ncbi:MAG: sulfatase-like hydrolase/transferase, partial [Nanoarchaeota archaeon]